jgi:Autotransporter beta-domain
MGVCLLSTGSASAQSVFCPANVSSAPSAISPLNDIRPIAGNCTNPAKAGAYSGAALASQAIGDLAGSVTTIETTTAVQSIEERREIPPQPCPAGEVLIDGICRTPPTPVTTTAPPTPVTTTEVVGVPPPGPATSTPPTRAVTAVPKPARTRAAKRTAPQVVAAPTLPVHKPSIPVIYDQSFRIGAWAQGFGDYEHRTGDRSSIINCCTGQTSNTNIVPLLLEATSNTSWGGFVGGIDGVKRGLWSGQDGVVFGLLGGYTWTDISLTTTALSTAPNRTASGSSSTSAHINGPSLGGYLSYFNGPLSNDFLVKDDFLSLNETESQLLGFGVCSCYGFNAPFVAPQSGSGSANLNQLTLSDDVNYRIPLSGWMWMAPTAGLRYVNSSYSSSAQALGLADGYLFRLQGGAKLGMDSLFNNVRVTTTLTGLLFNDVIVHGNNIQGGSFGQDAGILNDQGRMQGEGIAMVNLDFGRGLSASVEGDIYGGQGIFGAGGKATVRMQW